jgi:hypothetical protein
VKFTNWEVTRVGTTVVLSVFCDGPGHMGSKMQIALELALHDQALLHEQMLKHLVDCAELYEHLPEDALKGTLKLIKGQDT